MQTQKQPPYTTQMAVQTHHNGDVRTISLRLFRRLLVKEQLSVIYEQQNKTEDVYSPGV